MISATPLNSQRERVNFKVYLWVLNLKENAYQREWIRKKYTKVYTMFKAHRLQNINLPWSSRGLGCGFGSCLTSTNWLKAPYVTCSCDLQLIHLHNPGQELTTEKPSLPLSPPSWCINTTSLGGRTSKSKIEFCSPLVGSGREGTTTFRRLWDCLWYRFKSSPQLYIRNQDKLSSHTPSGCPSQTFTPEFT